MQSVQCSVTANSWPKCSARLLQQWSALESSQSSVLLIAQIVEYNLNNIRDDPPWLKLQGDIQIIGLNKWDKSCFKKQNIQAVFNLILIFCCVREGALQSSWTERQHQSFLLVVCLGCVQYLWQLPTVKFYSSISKCKSVTAYSVANEILVSKHSHDFNTHLSIFGKQMS